MLRSIITITVVSAFVAGYFWNIAKVTAADEQIEGSWTAHMEVPDLQRSFNGLITFSQGGGLVSSAWAVGHLNNTGSGHGTWRKKGDHDIAINILFLWFNAGVLEITGRAHGTINLVSGSNAISGSNITFESFDSAGNTLFSSTGTLSGIRIPSE